MRIGICDDCADTCTEIKNYIGKYKQQSGRKLSTKIWHAGEELMVYLAEGNEIDVLFLDIDLVTTTGVDVGQFIRNRINNYSMKIIYISANTSYAMSLFQVQPLDFLVKPLTYQKVEACLELAIKLFGNPEDAFPCKVAGETHFIPYRRILYFECTGRKINVITESKQVKTGADGKTDQYEYYGRIKDVAKIVLSNDSFLQVHQSYIVHTTYIQNYQYTQMQMMNGIWIPISQKFQKDVRKKMLERS